MAIHITIGCTTTISTLLRSSKIAREHGRYVPAAMKPVEVSEIRIDESGKLVVKPTVNPDKICRFVYRAAMEVDWDEESQSFICPSPREWSYLDWYQQVLAAVVSELGILLKVTYTTAWINIPNELKEEISCYVYEKST